MGRESVEIFYHMLGKGLVIPPNREEVVGMARIGIVTHEPDPDWLFDAHNNHWPERWKDSPALHNAIIPHNGSLWGNTPTPDHALQKVLLQKQRQAYSFVPATPYGPFVIVPAQADLSAVPFVEEWWHTDGVYAWKEGGPKLTGMEAATAIQADFERAAAKLPFRADGGVFFQTIKLDDHTYRLYAIDTGWLDPQDRDVTVRVQLDGEVRVRDIFTRRELDVRNGTARFVVPAGTLRILEATVQ
ncbi:MAG: hypothetical protein IID38_03485 [Planctomycetes bacterium]|nr:hypothetical protein [Planctomycetota bacterium]